MDGVAGKIVFEYVPPPAVSIGNATLSIEPIPDGAEGTDEMITVNFNPGNAIY